MQEKSIYSMIIDQEARLEESTFSPEQMEERLRVLRIAVREAAVSIVITDADLDYPGPHIVYVNRAFEQVSGYTAEEVLGHSPRILQGPGTDRQERRKLRETLEHGRQFTGELTNYRKDGSTYEVEVSISPVRNERGRVTHYVGIQRDVTEQKRIEREYRGVVDHVGDIIYRMDLEGRFTFANQATVRVTGFAEAGFLNQSFLDFLPPGWHEAAVAFFKTCLDEQVPEADLQFEFPFLTRDGRALWFEQRVRRIYEHGRFTGLQGIVRDMTTQRQAIEALESALGKERELGELKTRFVSMASHELRTPLATIKASAELLDRFGDRWEQEKKKKHLQRICDNVNAMVEMLDDILHVGRVDEGKFKFVPERFEVSSFVTTLIEEIQIGVAAHHRLEVGLPPDPIHLVGDPKLLRLMMNNLLTNAAKYSPAGSTIGVTLVQTPDHVVLSIADEGIGIPEADQQRLFEPFHRGANVDAIRGTGLGLSIVKRAVDAHGGHIRIASAEGKGTTATIALPVHPEAGWVPSSPG